MRILDDNCFYSKDIEVKIFQCEKSDDLEQKINRWLEESDVAIISIKYSTLCSDTKILFSAMIVYKW